MSSSCFVNPFKARRMPIYTMIQTITVIKTLYKLTGFRYNNIAAIIVDARIHLHINCGSLGNVRYLLEIYPSMRYAIMYVASVVTAAPRIPKVGIK